MVVDRPARKPQTVPQVAATTSRIQQWWLSQVKKTSGQVGLA